MKPRRYVHLPTVDAGAIPHRPLLLVAQVPSSAAAMAQKAERKYRSLSSLQLAKHLRTEYRNNGSKWTAADLTAKVLAIDPGVERGHAFALAHGLYTCANAADCFSFHEKSYLKHFLRIRRSCLRRAYLAHPAAG